MSRLTFCAVLGVVSVLVVSGQAEIQVNTYGEHNQTDPVVAMSDEGNFVVVWRSHAADGRGGGVYARRFDANGTALSDEFQVNISAVDADNWAPAVAMGPSGRFVVAWPAASEGDSDLVARVYDAAGTSTTEELPVAVSPIAAASTPSIAMNASGAFVVIWTNWHGDRYVGKSYAAGRVYDPDGQPVSDEFDICDRPQQKWPDVAMDESGRFVVTWIRMGDTYCRPYGEYIMIRQFEADGTPLGRATPLTDDLNSRWYGPSVASGRDGGFLVTWAVGPFPYDIVAQAFDADAVPLAPPLAVNTVMDGNQGHPRVASDGDDDYLVVWDSHASDASGCCVRGQFCTQDGEVYEGEMVLNTDTSERCWYPDAAMAPDESYVVVWIGESSAGSGYDVFAEVGAKP
jgi:hypothetical protein